MQIQETIVKYQNFKGIRNQRASVCYGLALKKFASFTKKELKNLNNDDITAYQMHIKSILQDSSQALHGVALKSFFEFTNNRGLTKIVLSEITIPRVIEKIPAYVVLSEFDTLCDVAKNDLRKLVCLHLLWYTGMRVSELCDLDIERINLSESCAQINTKKAFRPRFVFWPEETNNLLREYIGNREGALFQGEYGIGHLTTKRIQVWIQDLRAEAGIKKKITPHSFRHGFAHENLNIGTDLPAIQNLMGHKNAESLFKYTKRLDEDIKDVGREAIRKRTALIKLRKYVDV